MDYTKIYEQWLEKAVADPDLISELVSINGKKDDIEDRFYRELEFGTGGIRGVIGAGTNRINVYVVAKATQGYCNYLLKNFERPSVAIAYDSRIKSRQFAETAAGVFAANGVKAYIFSRLMPTPTLSFAVRRLGCSGGIVITASHNPAKYNGYKVYADDGSQITTGTADDILEYICGVDIFESIKSISFNAGMKKGAINYISEEIVSEYIEKISNESLLKAGTPKDISIIYTPLNGTGISCIPKCLEKNGFVNISIPDQQRNPDGNFPTCQYPNPEIEEALSLAIEFADEKGAELVLATDPDCDRIGVAIKADGKYVLVNGNQMGALLFEFICSERIRNNKMPERPVVIKTIVTTDLAEKISSHYGVETINTLTGFKFIGEQLGRLEKLGELDRYLFGFEESYGYLSCTDVRDKDAVNASLLISEMFVWYKMHGLTLIDALNKLYQKFGYYTEKLITFVFEGFYGFHQMQSIMETLRQTIQTSIAGIPVEKRIDYKIESTGLPKSDVLKYWLIDGATATVRPSGTEPKLKIYLSACGINKEDCSLIIESIEKYFEDLINENKNCY